MDKKQLSERDICTKFITPALEKAGWNLQTQIREEFSLTDGRIIVRGHLHTRGKNKRADYVLFYKPNLPIAILEAKDNNHTVGDGIQQALGYAELLQVPFVFSSNGDRLLFHNKINTDGILEKELEFEAMPSPDSLWRWWSDHQGFTPEQAQTITQDYYSDGILLELYEGGQPCLFAILLSGSVCDTFHAQVQQLFEVWIAAIASVLMAEGMEANVAKQQAEKAVILVQGSSNSHYDNFRMKPLLLKDFKI